MMFNQSNIIGQGIANKFEVWLDSQQVDGKKIFVGWCQNNTTSPVLVKYEAVLKFANKAGKVVRGTTLTLPATPTLLPKAVFTVNGLHFEHLRLTVTNREDEILAFDHIITAPLTKINKVSSRELNPPPNPPKVERQQTTSYNDAEIDGLILDETRSKLARDFYETFYRNWSSMSVDARGQTIVVRESPGRIGIGTNVIVVVDDKPVTRLNLQPRADLIDDLAGQLVAALVQYFNDPNNHEIIEGNDLTGSGIY